MTSFGRLHIVPVDEHQIRDRSVALEDFGNYGIASDFPEIPPETIWISSRVPAGELDVLIGEALHRLKLEGRGASPEQAYDAAIQYSSGLRRRLAGNRPAGQPGAVKIKQLQGFDTPSPVWLVDGEAVRDTLDPDFIEGGNSQAYRYVPAGEIWIDQEVPADERRFVVAHEAEEARLMGAGLDYPAAHRLASQQEWRLRHADLAEAAIYFHETLDSLGLIGVYSHHVNQTSPAHPYLDRSCRTVPGRRGPVGAGRGCRGRTGQLPASNPRGGTGDLLAGPCSAQGRSQSLQEMTAGPDWKNAPWAKDLQRWEPAVTAPAPDPLETAEELAERLKDEEFLRETALRPGDWPIRYTTRAKKSLDKLVRNVRYRAIMLDITALGREAGRPKLVRHKDLEGQGNKPTDELFWRAHVGTEYRCIYGIRPSHEIWVYDVVNKNEADRLYEKVKNVNVSDMVVAELLEQLACRVIAAGLLGLAAAVTEFELAAAPANLTTEQRAAADEVKDYDLTPVTYDFDDFTK